MPLSYRWFVIEFNFQILLYYSHLSKLMRKASLSMLCVSFVFSTETLDLILPDEPSGHDFFHRDCRKRVPSPNSLQSAQPNDSTMWSATREVATRRLIWSHCVHLSSVCSNKLIALVQCEYCSCRPSVTVPPHSFETCSAIFCASCCKKSTLRCAWTYFGRCSGTHSLLFTDWQRHLTSYVQTISE